MFCSKCGRELKPDARFCAACGTPAGGKGGRRRTLPWIIAGAAVLVLLAVLIPLLATRQGRSAGAQEAAHMEAEATGVPQAAAPEPAGEPVRPVLPDIGVWQAGESEQTETETDGDTGLPIVRQGFQCAEPDVYFAYLELIGDKRFALEQVGETVVYEGRADNNQHLHDCRRYAAAFRYTGDAKITRDALRLPHTETEQRCDVLVTCEIWLSLYEDAEEDTLRRIAVSIDVLAFPEAEFIDAGTWDGVPAGSVPELESRTITFLLDYKGSLRTEKPYTITTAHDGLTSALEEAGLLTYKTVGGKRRLYAVGGVPAAFEKGESWVFELHKDVELTPAGEIRIIDGGMYQAFLVNGDLSAADPAGRTCEPGDEQRELNIIIEIQADGCDERTTLTTRESMLGPALRAAGLIEGTQESWGYFIRSVNGICADDTAGQYWALQKNGKALSTGIDVTPLAEGDVYTLRLEG